MNKYVKYALAGALSALSIFAAGCGGDKKAEQGNPGTDKPVIVASIRDRMPRSWKT